MPPKKAKEKEVVIIDGVDTTDMPREKLEFFVLKIKEQLDREREDRNYFQLERDKIRTFWEITRNQCEELRAELRNREREREEGVEEIEQAKATSAQRAKHLSSEQADSTSALHANCTAALQHAHGLHTQQLKQLHADKKQLRENLREVKDAAAEEIRKVKMVNAEQTATARQDFEMKCHELEIAAEQRRVKTKEDLEAAMNADLSELEERKSQQITAIVKGHNAAFAELKDYYNEITLNNLGLISSLKLQLEETMHIKERAEGARAEALAGKRQLAEPLEKALMEAVDLRRRAHNADQDRSALVNKTRMLTEMEKEYDGVRWEYEVLLQRFDNVKLERDELQGRFNVAVLELQQRAALKGSLIQQRLQRVYDKEDGKWRT